MQCSKWNFAMKAPLPAAESQRLAALRRFDVLDTPPEISFDDLTLLASQICQTPIALVSLIDADRQWFKSRVGLDAQETPRDLAFCAHALLQPDALTEVPDALLDPRFFDNSLVTEDPKIRFYAGAPLVVSDGHALGTLCVIDRIPRTLSEPQRQALQALGRHVVWLIEARQTLAARERAERALLQMNEHLHRAMELAQQADRIKSGFLATMSHELRTPLNSIIGFTGILLQEMAGPLNEEQQRQLSKVRDSSRHLLSLINDVLDISKIEAGQLDVAREPFDLRKSIDKVIALVRPLADKKGLALQAQVAPDLGQALGEARRVEQVLINLLSNAIKFTDTGSVNVHAAPGAEGWVRVDVTDTGIGIAPEHLASLFEPFRQIDNGLSRVQVGTGLGLAIARKLAELMGGGIEVSSRVGHGSVFSLNLPDAAP